MDIKSAQFVISNTDFNKCPAPVLPEYAFIGRSNVGKSSLINMLCVRKDMAKTSGKPGKTQLINHFLINQNWYLVDLPGYGYAQVSRDKRDKWDQFIKEYIVNRPNLMCMMVLIDARLEPQRVDLEFIQWLGENGIPFVMVFTKMDKLTKTKIAANLKNYKNELATTWEIMPEMYYTSAEEKTGRTELLAFIDESNKLFQKP